ncbi:MAG: cell envelope integrity protein TolA [Desulfobacteraceae bacterium]|nr:cell envelope integrity protein TolA [Desulfobacteraceae bacterium]
MKNILFAFCLAILTCSCASINVDPNKRVVNCSELTSPETDTKACYIRIVTDNDNILSVVAFGSARFPQSINFQYGNGCYINIIRDVTVIERVNDSVHRVILRNGKTIKIGTFNTQYGSATPYNAAQWNLVVAIDEERLQNRYSQFDPFKNLKKLTVTNTPISSTHAEALAELKAQEKKQEEESRKRIEEELSKKERAEIEQKAASARNENKKRDLAKASISNQQNIGRQICKNGSLQYYTAYIILGQPQYMYESERGWIAAFLEGFSIDGYRIQFRVAGWGTASGYLRQKPSAHPSLDNFSTQPGIIYWDDVKDWYLCGE